LTRAALEWKASVAAGKNPPNVAVLEDLSQRLNYRQINWCMTVGLEGQALPADEPTPEDKVCQVAPADRRWEGMVTGEERKDSM